MSDSAMTRRKFLQGSTLVGASLTAHPFIPSHAQTNTSEQQSPLSSGRLWGTVRRGCNR